MPNGAKVKTTDRFFFFHSDWPSQWYQCNFSVNGVKYRCAEQYMMAEKARTFGDTDTLKQIMQAKYPREQKALGRKVHGFNESKWSSVCREVVYQGNLAKFSQNFDLKKLLLETGERIIAEASPYDKIWGIGLSEDDPRALRLPWPGQNLLGQVLMRVRNAVRRF